MTVGIILVSFISAIQIQASQGTISTFTLNGYTGIYDDTNTYNWYDARDYCYGNLGEAPLASIHSSDDWNDILSLRTSLSIQDIGNWIGGNDLLGNSGTASDWVWQDGTENDYTSMWKSDQPSDNDEHCAAVHSSDDLVHDYDCETIYFSSFICGESRDNNYWRPIFKISNDNNDYGGESSVYNYFMSGTSNYDTVANDINFINDETQFNASSINTLNNYRSLIIDDWSKYANNDSAGNESFNLVKLVFYKDGSEVQHMIYKVNNGENKDAFFSYNNYVSSKWRDFTQDQTYLYWGPSGTDRQFYVVRNHGGCENDRAWMVISQRDSGCTTWSPAESVYNPEIRYSDVEGNAHLASSGESAIADTLVFYINSFPGEFLYEICNITKDDLNVDWDNEIGNENSQVSASIDINPGFDQNGAFILQTTIETDYKVTANYDSWSSGKILGTTYILDTFDYFNSDGTTERLLSNPNPCENRKAESFVNKSYYHDYFTYTLQPSDPNQLGNDDYGLSYPDPNIWNLSMVNGDSCTRVEYSHDFTFTELLTTCGGFEWVDSGDKYELQGSIFLSLISPNPLFWDSSITSDTGEYIGKSLISQPVTLSFIKASTLVNNGFVDLFGNHFVYSQFDDENLLFTLTLATFVPNWMKLDSLSPNLVLITPTSNGLKSLNQDSSHNVTVKSIYIVEHSYSSGSDCWVNDEYHCWQKFDINIELNECPSSTGVLLTSNYQFQTDLACITGNEDICNDFLNNTNDYQSEIISMDNIYLDYSDSCDSTVYEIQFYGNLTFYSDNTFSEIRDSTTNPYSINGDDRVYVKVLLFGTENYQVFGMKIGSIYLCTADVNDGTNSLPTNEGCLDSESGLIDTSLIYNIETTTSMDYQLINSDETDNYEMFSFLLPTIADDRFFITVNVELTLNTGGTVRRRMILQDSNSQTQNRYEYVNSDQVFVTDVKVDSEDEENENDDKNNDDGITLSLLLTIVGILCGVIIIILVIVGIFCLRSKHNSGKTAEQTANSIVVVKDGIHNIDTTGNEFETEDVGPRTPLQQEQETV